MKAVTLTDFFVPYFISLDPNGTTVGVNVPGYNYVPAGNMAGAPAEENPSPAEFHHEVLVMWSGTPAPNPGYLSFFIPYGTGGTEELNVYTLLKDQGETDFSYKTGRKRKSGVLMQTVTPEKLALKIKELKEMLEMLHDK